MGLFGKKKENCKINFPDEAEWEEIHSRFDNVKEANDLFKQLEWPDYYRDVEKVSKSRGISIYSDRIETRRGIIKYSDFGLANLDHASRRQFAFWLADFLPQGTIFHIRTIYETIGSSNSKTYYYVTPNNNVAIGGLGSYGTDVKAGFNIYVTDSRYAYENYYKMYNIKNDKNDELKKW